MGMGVHRMEHKGECQGEYTREGGCQKGEYQRRVISKGVIPKSKGGTLGGGGSQGEHGGAKEVPRGCQREGVYKRVMIRGEAKVGKGEGGSEGRQCQGNIFQQGDTKEGGTEVYQKGKC